MYGAVKQFIADRRDDRQKTQNDVIDFGMEHRAEMLNSCRSSYKSRALEAIDEVKATSESYRYTDAGREHNDSREEEKATPNCNLVTIVTREELNRKKSARKGSNKLITA